MISGYLNWALLSLIVFCYAFQSERLKKTPFSSALVFVLTGILLSSSGFGWLDLRVTPDSIRKIAEATLALVLFTDAAQADLAVLRNSTRLPLRLLGLGLPLTILLGAGVGLVLFPDFKPVEVAILAVVLAPTDAALGQPVVTNPLVPPRIREDLSVESGLNDGICVPILFFLLAVSGAAGQAESGASGALPLARLFLQQVGFALVVGMSFAALGSWCTHTGLKRHWISDDWQPLLPVALSVGCYCVAQLLGGSGFIACFSCGLMFGGLTGRGMDSALVAAEGTGDVLSLITWVTFGTAVVAVVLPHLSWVVLLYAVLSLTLVRMLPVALATAGLGLDRWTTLFIGWFGPRGLASIVFAVIVLEENLPHGAEIVATITVTVLLSVVAHALSAPRLVALYGRLMQSRT